MRSAVAIVVAAGSGERLGLGMPKAFVEIGGCSLLRMAVDAAAGSDRIDGVVAVVPSFALGEAREIVGPDVTLVGGGDTRQASVRAGLLTLGDGADAVVVHDAARPFAPPSAFDAVLEGLRRWDGCVPGIGVPDTVKRVGADGEVVRTEPRDELVLTQTPQAFRAAALAQAHARAATEERAFTDDAACLEWAGFRVGVVAGDTHNFKITTLDDLRRATAFAELPRG